MSSETTPTQLMFAIPVEDPFVDTPRSPPRPVLHIHDLAQHALDRRARKDATTTATATKTDENPEEKIPRPKLSHHFDDFATRALDRKARKHQAALRAQARATETQHRKLIREAWIRNSARQIAQLNIARMIAEQEYHNTPIQANLVAWRRATLASNNAVLMDGKLEERRIMFMPRSMGGVMRLGEWNLAEDGFAGCGSEGALVGVRMALMERVCAEVMRGD